jgi:acyl-CoA thioesterase I
MKQAASSLRVMLHAIDTKAADIFPAAFEAARKVLQRSSHHGRKHLPRRMCAWRRNVAVSSPSGVLNVMARLTLRPTLVIAAAYIALAWTTDHRLYAEESTVRIVVLGDSLTAGYGILGVDAFPAKLERALRARGLSVTVANAGVSGDTAAMGLARLDRSIRDDTDAVILELGANDMLRGFEPSVTRAALGAILRKLEARRVAVLLCGVRTEPSFGHEYKNAFAAMFSGLAKEHNVLFYPAFDDAFVDDARLKLPDGLHPTPAGIEAVVTRILPAVETLIDRARRRDR